MKGAIWLLWNFVNINIRIIQTDHEFIHYKVAGLDKADFTLTVVYSNSNTVGRNKFQKDVHNFGTNIQGPWIIIGACNAICRVNKCSKGWGSLVKLLHFEQWINSLSFIDLGFCNCSFTWARGKNANSKIERHLDRGLHKMAWRMQ